MTTSAAEIANQSVRQPRSPRPEWVSYALVSALIVIPCFWHEFLVCVDLGSHTYANWIANLIAAGKAPGLYVATQKINVLFDWVLSAMCAYFGYGFGEKIAAAISVLVFFWGSFAFFTRLAGKLRWDVAAPLAMFSYGWTFQTGLFNYYLSIGLALAALAALWTRDTRGRVLCLILLPLVMLSHPLGLVVFGGFAIFEFSLRRFGVAGIAVAFSVCIALMFGTRIYLARHFWVAYSNRPMFLTSGPDQLILYSSIYLGIGFITLFLFLMLVIEALDLRLPRPQHQKSQLILLGTLYVLVKSAIFILPDEVQWTGNIAKASLLVNRATLVSAILLLALFAVLPSHRWKTRVWVVLSFVFFSVLYLSTGTLSKLQRNAYDTVRALPPGSRIVATGNWQPLLAVNNPHLAERACIQYCFVVSNYEIASRQFRVRAVGPNPIVEVSLVQNDRMQDGIYVVRAQDLPLYALHPCSTAGSVCLGKLAAGDQNGHPSIELGTAITTSPR